MKLEMTTHLAEVMDKLTTVAEVWKWAIGLGVVCLLATVWKWWLLVLAPLAACIILAMTGFADADMAPFIERESPGHGLRTLPAVLLPLIGGAAGPWLRKHTKRRSKSL